MFLFELQLLSQFQGVTRQNFNCHQITFELPFVIAFIITFIEVLSGIKENVSSLSEYSSWINLMQCEKNEKKLN